MSVRVRNIGNFRKPFQVSSTHSAMELRLLENSTLVSEWMEVARFAGLVNPSQVQHSVRQSLKNPSPESGLALYMTDGSRILATAYLRRAYGEGAQTIQLFHMAVRPEFRHRQIGTALIAEVCAFAKNLRNRYMTLSTVEAGRFYSLCGFQKYGQVPGIASQGKTREYYFREL